MKATHWSAFRNPEDWKENPHDSAEDAAEEFFISDEEGWDSRDALERSGFCIVTVFGFIETSETLTDEDSFDGYEEGQEYFKATGETLGVKISRTSRIIG